MIPNPAFRPISAVCCALALVLGVSASSGAVSPGSSDFDRAIASARSGHSDEAFSALEKAFAAGFPTPSAVLNNPAFSALRTNASQRARLNSLLRAHARESKIAIVAPGEPGTALRFIARIQDTGSGAPVPRAFVYLYQTDHLGYYNRDDRGSERGPENARVFGVARADQQGRIEVNTIVPGSYPGGGFRHIHYVIRADGYEESMREVILDEDPRPTRQQKEWAVRNGDVVARRTPGKGGVSTLDVVLRISRSGS